jgi:thymidylate synthase
MNTLDLNYQNLLTDIISNGVNKEDRTGTGTISVFGRQIRHKMSDGFPLLTTKKMAWKSIVTELIWFLRGDTNIKFLVDNGCHIWDGDAYKNYLNVVMFEKPGYLHEKHGHLNMSMKKEGDNYLPFTQEEFINKIKTDDKFRHWGDLGKIYVKQWRSWTNYTGDEIQEGTYEMTNEPIDQIQNLINDLKTNPDSRRLLVSAWNPAELDQMVLPPCHYGFQVYTRELNRLERIQLGLKAGWEPKGHIENFENEDLNGWNIPTRAISLMFNMRSCDTFLGLPFNIASYGLLLEIIAKIVNMVPDELIGNLGDVHLYSNHIEQAKEQIGRELSDEERYNIWFNNNYETGMERFFDPNNLPNFDDPYYEPTPKRTREPYPLPTLNINTEFWSYEGGECGEGPLDAVKVFESFKDDNFCKCLLEADIQLGNYQSHPPIKAELSN